MKSLYLVLPFAVGLGLASPTQAQTICHKGYIPVCASKDGMEKTYGNACEARADGAYVVNAGACERPRPKSTQYCPAFLDPVCAVKGKMMLTYSNACFALADRARILSKGLCGNDR